MWQAPPVLRAPPCAPATPPPSGKEAAVQAVVDDERTPPALQQLADLLQRGREAAVEPDHQHRFVLEARVSGLHAIELLPGDGERLLDEHVPGRLERAHHLVRVLVM